jgi:hypothetical protein
LCLLVFRRHNRGMLLPLSCDFFLASDRLAWYPLY